LTLPDPNLPGPNLPSPKLPSPAKTYYWEESPWFWNEIREVKEVGGLILVAATGPPNFGKSAWCLSVMEDLHHAWELPKLLDADSVVFNAKQFRYRMEHSGEWECTLWDEPNKGLSHRDWYEELNREVTTYLQTFRFRHKPLFLALPHIKLLDKSARAVLIGEAMMKYPSLARVHQLEPDMYGNREFFKYFRGEVQEYMPNRKLWGAYEKAKNEFHFTDFASEKFEERPSAIEHLKSWQIVFTKVKQYAEPDKLKVQVSRLDPTQGKRWSASKISYSFDCSDRTAKHVVHKLEEEEQSKKILPPN